MSTRRKRNTPYLLYFCLFVLISVTGALATAAYYYQNQIWSTWNSLSEAQATIIGQLLLFFGAIWAAVLVPLLFSEKLRSLEDAAASAHEAYEHIKIQLEKTAEESKVHLRNISRYQQMQLGFIANDSLLSLIEGVEAKKDFIDTAWESTHPKISVAMSQLHGGTRNAINNCTWRSPDWWERLRSSNALREYFADFKAISDAKSSVSKGAEAPLETLKRVNDALQHIEEFRPDTVQVEVRVAPQVSASPATPPFTPPTPEEQQHPN